jgi:PAS domain S-box-containing protein
MTNLHSLFLQLDLRGKITAILLAVAIALGGMVFLTIALVARHMVTEHGQDLHLVEFLLPLFSAVGIVILVALTYFGRFSARFITAHLIEVSAAAEAIATSGRPETHLPVRHNDEFGRLSAAFNTMVDRLAESYAELEQRVAERTRDYEESQYEAQKSINLLREAVQSIAQGFTIYDENDRLVLCNEAYLNFYEASRDLIVPGQTFEEIVREGAERGQYQAALGNVDAWVKGRVAQHQNANGEVIEQKLGDGRWLMIVEYRTPSGYIVGNRIDITELKHTAEALHQRELYLRATLDNLPFFFWLKDAESRFLAVNKVFAEACGRANPEEVAGLCDSDVWPQDLAERYQADDREVMASRREKTVEEPVAGGSAAGWIETYKKPVIAADGTLLGTVGFARDISDRRHAAEKIREHSEQLKAIFALSPDGFVSFDSHYRVKYASPAFQRMTGFAETDVVGLDEAAFSDLLARACIPAAAFPGMATLRATQKVGAGGTATDDSMGRRLVIEMAGPGKRVLEVGIRLSRTETVSQILYFRDITHETEVDRLKSEFLSTAAHELRTPMASIYGFTELLLNQDFDTADQRDFLATIFKQSELMISIINELLDLARIEARRGKDFVIENIDMRALLHEIVAGFKTPLERPAPLLPPPNGPHWVRADRKKLTQAVSNVLSNAYKYSPDGGTVSIAFSLAAGASGEPDEQTPSLIGIRISDHGIGMAPEQLARVCERFYRVDTSGKIPGTGLGMSIVKEIVELHGGALDLDSQVGTGTRVTLWLPAANEEKTT